VHTNQNFAFGHERLMSVLSCQGRGLGGAFAFFWFQEWGIYQKYLPLSEALVIFASIGE